MVKFYFRRNVERFGKGMARRLQGVTCGVMLSVAALLFSGNSASSDVQKNQSTTRGASVGAWDTYNEAKDYATGGIGTRRDYSRARDLYLKVARGRDRNAAMWAHFQLGKIYSRPPLRDDGKAKSHFQSAIKLGELWSARYLIDIYGKEQQTSANRARMLELLNLMRQSDSQRIRRSARQLARQYGFAK